MYFLYFALEYLDFLDLWLTLVQILIRFSTVSLNCMVTCLCTESDRVKTDERIYSATVSCYTVERLS